MLTLAKRTISKVMGAFGAACLVASATPAIANTNANTSSTAAADVTEPLRKAQDEKLVKGDPRFRQLFANWRTLDTTAPGLPIEKPVVSIPSMRPVTGGRISSQYGMRVHPVLGRRKMHHGIDIAAPTGTPVYASADGLVGRANWFSSYGLYISIDHGAKLETRYAHLSRLAVAAGDTVKKGDIIGYVGSTGRSTGPHLHYEVRVDGLAVNPNPYMVDKQLEVIAAR
ncbi:MAG: M23 family metallopeptidase [Pseudomonadota bacterium]